MSEPLTDKDIEELKEWRHGTGFTRRWLDSEGTRFDRLIATVESLKESQRFLKDQFEASIEMLAEKKEENAKLKEMDGNLKSLVDEFREENAKLRKPSKNDRRQHDLNYAAQAPERRVSSDQTRNG